MSWAEVRKINSDMSEPLNYTNYIYDISNTTKESYVLDPNNSSIWDDLCLNSCYLYGYTAIHDIVLERLTEKNIDNLWNASGCLGRQLNNFHGNEAYSLGNFNDVCNGMTLKAYNDMIEKFRKGYCRYVNTKLAGDDMSTWISEVYSIDISPCTDIDTLLADEEAWGKVLASEPLLVAFTSSKETITKICESETAVQRMGQIIKYAGQNGEAIQVIAELPDLVEAIVNDQTSMEWVAQEENSLLYLMKYPHFATPALSSTTAMTAFGNSEIAVKLFSEFFVKLLTSRDAITKINAETEKILPELPKVWQGEKAMDDLNKLIEDEEALIELLGSITTDATMVNNFVEKVVENETYCTNVVQSQDIMTSICADQTCSETLAASEMAMGLVAASETAMTAVAASETAMTAVGNSKTAMDAILASDQKEKWWTSAHKVGLGLATYASIDNNDLKSCESMTAVAASSTAMTAVAASSTARSSIIASSNAMNEVTANKVAMNAILNTSDAMSDNDLMWKLNSMQLLRTSYSGLVQGSQVFKYVSPGTKHFSTESVARNVYVFSISGEGASHDQCEIGRTSVSPPASGITNSSVSGKSGYIKSDNLESMMCGTPNIIVFCSGTETRFNHADGSTSGTTTAYKVTSFG